MKKRLLSILLILALLLSLLPAALAEDITIVDIEGDEALVALTDVPNTDASGECGVNVGWALSDGVLTIYGSGEMDSFQSKHPSWYPFRDEITRVVVEAGVTSLGAYAFCCQDEDADYPKLAEITLADSVKTVGSHAAADCPALRSLRLGRGLETIEESAFANTPKINTVILPDGLREIGAAAFGNSGLTGIAIPDSVSKLGDSAFGGCKSMLSAVIGAGVTELGEVFGGNEKLKTVYFMGAAPEIVWNAFSDITAAAFYPDDGSWSEEARKDYGGTLTWTPYETYGTCGDGVSWSFWGSQLSIGGSGSMDDYEDGTAPWAAVRDAIQAVYVGAGVERIGSYAFANSYNLHSVAFARDSRLEIIRPYAFFICTTLQEIEFPQSLRRIEDHAFGFCAFRHLELTGEDLEEIGANAFAFDVVLESVISAVESVGSQAFFYCVALKDIYFLDDAPSFAADSFSAVNATAWYRARHNIWAESDFQNYGGTLNWQPMEQPQLRFDGMDTDGIWLSWTATPGAERYFIEDWNWSASEESLLPIANGKYVESWYTGTNSILLPSEELLMGEEYHFNVAAVSGVPSDWSEELVVTYQPFTDVSGKKTLEYLAWAFNWGIVRGTSKTSFSPDDTCTRVQFVMMLWKMCGSEEAGGKNPFKDVSGAKTTKAILWALDRGVINSGDYFHPDDPISRVQIVMILWKLQGSPEVEGTIPFKDVKGAKTQKAVLWAYQCGITKGTDKTHFSPDAPCTRIQLVVFLYKYWSEFVHQPL